VRGLSKHLLAFAILALALLPRPVAAWGFPGHRLVNAEATKTLPPPLRALFEGNEAYVREHAIDPDLWVIAGRPGEAPNHFLDIDAFGPFPFDQVPLVEADHLARHGAQAAERGRVPWRVGDVYRELVTAFAAGDEARVLERAAVLGHYVGDAHVPLHSVVNYNGQLTDQKGVHARWETALLARFERQIEPRVEAGTATRVADPVAFIFDVIKESYARSRELLAADKETTSPRDFADTAEDDRYDDAYYSAFFERESEDVVSRLDAAATALGSLWLSAWQEAGRPELDPAFRIPYVRGATRLVMLRTDVAFEDGLARGAFPQLSRLRQRGSVVRLDAPVVPGPEPLFVAAAREDLDATGLLLPEAYPFAPFAEEKRHGANYGSKLTLVDADHTPWVAAATWTEKDITLREPEGWTGKVPAGAREFALRTADQPLYGLLYDDGEDATRGFDSMLLSTSRDVAAGAKLKPRPPSAGPDSFATLALPAAAGEIALPFRLFALAPDAKSLLLHQPPVRTLLASRPRVAAAAGALGGSSDEAYLRGDLGPTLWSGGDGTAEARFLETAAFAARQFDRLLTFGLARTRWQVLIAQAPPPGPAFAEWQRRLQAGKDGAVLRKLRRLSDQYLATLDGIVGDLAQQIEDDQAVALLTPTSFVLAGPGVAAEKEVGPARSVDVAPTLVALLGLEPTASEGHVLRAVLSRMPPEAPTRGPGKTGTVANPTRPRRPSPPKSSAKAVPGEARSLQSDRDVPRRP